MVSMVVPSPRWHGIAGNFGAAKVRQRLGLAMVGFCHRDVRLGNFDGHDSDTFRESSSLFGPRIQRGMCRAAQVTVTAPHIRVQQPRHAPARPASPAPVTGSARSSAVTPQPPRHRRDRRRMHHAGQIKSPRRHGLVTAHASEAARLVTVRLGCFPGEPGKRPVVTTTHQKCGLSLQESMQTIRSCDGYLRI